MTVPARIALAAALLCLVVACGEGAGGESTDPTASAASAAETQLSSPAISESSDEQEGGITDVMREAADLEPVARYEPGQDVEPAASATGAMTVARGSHTASLLEDGTVLVVGGSKEQSNPEVYDPEAGSWGPASEIASRRTPPQLQSCLTAACWSPEVEPRVDWSRLSSAMIRPAELGQRPAT